ncbi:MAG: LLM class flavin-dependent oxidoreductase [Gammaproteobacteria bacterium]|nr:LLM class flavin-dependent oxidoreductase [Gammaproteobacteria bacterium]
MKFGVLQFFSWPGRRVPLPTVYERALDRIRIMDTSGYDAVWLAEHHFSTYSVCPSVHLMAMHAANLTRRLRIGTAVSLAAFYDPTRLAEEVAMLDVLSGGRVNWGAGRGFDRKEFEVFGVTEEDSYPRFRENVEIVLRAWREDRFSYQGQFHQYHDVEVLPKPLQKPHPPVWMASGSPKAISWSASQGHAILMDPHASHEELAEKYREYRRGLAEHGHSHDQDTPMARLVAIGRTDAEGREIARAGAAWTVGSYAKGRGAHYVDPVGRYVDQVIVHGSPARVIDELQRLEGELPLDYLLAAPLSHASFLRLTDAVMPALA